MALQALLLLSLTTSQIRAETVLGIYVYHRHGDRTPKALGNVKLTSLGADQVYASGAAYRDRYVDEASGSAVHGLSSDIASPAQLSVTAPVDTTLQNSAQAFLQGLYPPAGSGAKQTLANGTTVEAPLNGYQYIPVVTAADASSSTNSESNGWLQGDSGCTNAEASSNNYLISSEYRDDLARTKRFYEDLLPVINGTFSESSATFKNAYTIFDLINVARIHNQTIPSSDLLTNSTLLELQDLANTHEWNSAYNASDTIRAVSGATLAGQILSSLRSSLSIYQGGTSKSPILNVQFGAYATFLSFFGLAQLQDVSKQFTGVVDYASSMAFELVTNASLSSGDLNSDDVSVRFLFVNSSAAEHHLTAYPLFGRSEALLSWSDFNEEMQKFAVTDEESWCKACGTNAGVCATYSNSGSVTGSEADSANSHDVSKPVAGVIGALVALVVLLGVEGLICAIAGLTVVSKSKLAGSKVKSGDMGKGDDVVKA